MGCAEDTGGPDISDMNHTTTGPSHKDIYNMRLIFPNVYYIFLNLLVCCRRA